MTSSMTQDHNNLDKQIQKQMGCMAGFFQLFDRHHSLSANKFHSTKRLTSPSVSGSETASSEVSKELAKPPQTPKRTVVAPSPERRTPPPKAEPKPPKLTQPLPIFDLREGRKSSWKLKETSRLSLDSRATYDAKGNIQMKETRADRLILQSNNDEETQTSRSSTSVIARLMGLEPISQAKCVKPTELRRCTSDSRFTRDLFQHRFINGDDQSFPVDESQRSLYPIDRFPENGKSELGRESKSLAQARKSSLPVHRKNFFETEEAFPAPKESVSIYGEMEKRLKMRGIDEVTKDLDTLKQILEAWQLKGLLHSRTHEEEQLINHQNIVYDRNIFEDSPNYSRGGGARRNLPLCGGGNSLRRERHVRSPTTSESNVRRSNSIVKSKSLTVEIQKGVNGSTENRRGNLTVNSPSPRGNPRRYGSNNVGANRSPRGSKKGTAEINRREKMSNVVVQEDESSSVSESSLSTPSQIVGAEVLKGMDSKEEKNLLERCDKLLHNIAEMNVTEQLSSPVSVLDSSFYESAASPSPIMKRAIHFKGNSRDELLDEEGGRPLILSNQEELEDASENCELVYISEILRTCNYFPGDCETFALLEKQQFLKGKDMSNNVSRLQRKLIFDTINEMLERHRQLPPWNGFSRPPLEEFWSEFQRIRDSDNNQDNDLVETICAIVKKDLAGDGWGEHSMELSAVILDIERMIFRDLVTESIGELVNLACQSSIMAAPRRRLVF
ncbi:hypothetical protein LIER_05081 [Lithospermum erythrorhizon]|uniref:DUF4378 domain-containing protein n=1 Tax=Lithospermum erythrorhizon TaxID=34254 RepID=A0AAV3P0E4_LITER